MPELTFIWPHLYSLLSTENKMDVSVRKWLCSSRLWKKYFGELLWIFSPFQALFNIIASPILLLSLIESSSPSFSTSSSPLSGLDPPFTVTVRKDENYYENYYENYSENYSENYYENCWWVWVWKMSENYSHASNPFSTTDISTHGAFVHTMYD